MKQILIVLFFTLLTSTMQQIPRKSSCPISDNPSQVFQCLTLNPQAFVDLISKNDFKSFCHMANGYMTCMSTYIRDCLGGKAASGILEELQDLNLKCCISRKTDECVIKNPALLQSCFSLDNNVMLPDGSEKSINSIALGDHVKAIDSNGKLINSEVVSILHKDLQKEVMFQVISDSLNNTISLSPTHLINVKDSGYINARQLKVGDTLRAFSAKLNEFNDFKVASIQFVIKKGLMAPLTNEGTILVNGIDSSCYAVVNSHKIADIAMTPVKIWYMLSKYMWQTSEATELINVDNYSRFLFRFVNSFVPSVLR